MLLLGWVIKSELFTGFSVRDFTEEKRGSRLCAVKLKIFLFFFLANTVLENQEKSLIFHVCESKTSYIYIWCFCLWKVTLVAQMRPFLTIFKHCDTQLYRQCTPCGFRSTIKRRDSQWLSNSRKLLGILFKEKKDRFTQKFLMIIIPN